MPLGSQQRSPSNFDYRFLFAPSVRPFGNTQLDEPANWHRHQFILGLLPIVDVVAISAAAIEMDQIGSRGNLFVCRAFDCHRDCAPFAAIFGSAFIPAHFEH